MSALATDTLRAALYARISQDDAGQQRGVDRQLDDARQLAEARGWDVVAEYADNDISAYTGKRRPGYNDLMRGAAAGEFDRIVVYMTSRLTRNRRERAELIDTLGNRGISVAAVSGPELDLSSASGRLIGEVLGAFDTAESAIKGERVARAAQQRAEEGRANGRCPYGWRRIYEHDDRGKITSFYDVEDMGEAEDLATAVGDLLNGRRPPRELMPEVESVLESEGLESAVERLRSDGLGASAIVDRLVETIGLDPPPATVVREIVQRIAEGDSIRGIARDLTERGIPTPTGKDKWGHTTVRRMTLRPGNIGKRTVDTHPPEGYGTGKVQWEGEPTPEKPWRGTIIGDATWPAIVDEDVWQRAVDRLGESDGNPLASAGNDPEHLLTGKAGAGRCGVCGSELAVKRRKSKRKKGEDVVYVLYVCNSSSGCVGRNRDEVDRLVGAVVVERLSRADAAGAFVPPSSDASEAERTITELRSRLDEAADMFAEGRITADQLERITSKLQPQIESARTDLRRASSRPTEPPAAFDELAQAEHAADVWHDLDLEDKRAVLHALGLTVSIMPTRPGPGFEPTDIHFEWEGRQ